MILADTDVLIDYLAGIEPMTARIAAYFAADRL
jgi:tRNA(fMet)-specific endonuclease VapC